jgi:Ser/Thr protein kinase RdoA (MazF antagonist)
MPSPPRIEYSIFDSEFISRVVQLKWGWKRARCEYWNRGMSDTYRVEQRGKSAYLKVYRHGWRSRAEIQGEVELLRFLRKRNISVSNPIRNNAGAFVEQIDAPEGRRYAVLFSEIKGAEPEINLENSRKCGFVVATVHKATDACPGSIRRPQLGIDHLVREPLKRIHPYLARRPRDLAYLTRISMALANAVVSLLPTSAPVFGICHGDVVFANLRRDDRGRFTLFDFDCSGYGWRSYDVAISLWSQGFEFSRSAKVNRLKRWNAFLDGYQAVRHLSDIELQAVNLFVPLRQIWMMGVHSSLFLGFGHRSIHDAKFEIHLEFIKNWLKAYKPL